MRMSTDKMTVAEKEKAGHVPPVLVVDKPYWFEDFAKKGNDDFVFVRVNGDGMEPTLRAGEIVLAQPGSQMLSDGVYVLNLHGRRLVRRVNVLKDGVQIYGDNSKYTPKTYTFEEAKTRIEVIGTVIAVLRQM